LRRFVLSIALALSCLAPCIVGATANTALAPGDAGDLLPGTPAQPTPTPAPQWLSVHAQITDTQQYHGAFPAAFSGLQSLWPHPDTAKTIDATLFLGIRLGKETEVYINPEIDQGFGLGNPPAAAGQEYNGTFGIAGFPSAEAYKVGRDSSYGRIQRIFVRQTFDWGGGDAQPIDPDINQLGGAVDPTHLVVTAGKFSVVDVFDTNAYAHDPKNDFLNWSIIDMAAFDYPADAWGYTYGASAEFSRGSSTLRGGLFQLSSMPNVIEIEHVPLRQYGVVGEFERRTTFLGGRPGAIKALAYVDSGYMGAYADAVARAAATASIPSTAAVRDAKHGKVGAGINVAQELAPNIGAFLRASAMNGTWEADDFTEIDRSVSGGITLGGALYHRPDDAIGVAAALNALSLPARQYFAAGGLGVLIGDGALAYSGERIIETYYKLAVTKSLGLTFDYQRITNPGYDTARGPVSVYGLRYHVQI
jgi:high affinity Mn2+ porin